MRKFITPACAIAAIFLAVFTVSPMAASGLSSPAETISPQEIDSYVQQQLAKTHIPGIAIAIVEGQDIVYLKGFGTASLRRQTPVTPETIFDLASCSKSFTALAVLTLWHDGIIDIDKPVITYLPEFRLMHETASSEITVRELLIQTSGIPGTFAEPLAFHNGPDAMEQLAASMAHIQSNNLPGAKFEYSNLNYALLGALVEKVTGQQFEDYVQEHIFNPLGMKNSTLDRKSPIAKTVPMGISYYWAE